MNNRSTKKQSGFSIVELMIATFIGLIVVTGLISVFETTSNLNRVQNGLARMQENGRFVLMQMKRDIEQAGYQYCMSSGGEQRDAPANSTTKTGSVQRAWKIYTADPIFPGVPLPTAADNYAFDPANLIHGHECNASSCSPNLTGVGSDQSFTMPSMGSSDGDRVAGTDILTIRYLHGSGLEVERIISSTATTSQILLSTFSSIVQSTVQPLDNNSRLLVAGCNDNPLYAVDVVSSGAGFFNITRPANEPFGGSANELTRVFNLDTDIRSITYYVAIKTVDERQIPTLYSVVNGNINELIEGVDRFDVLYVVDRGTVNNIKRYMTADEVQGMEGDECKPPIITGINANNLEQTTNNVQGCGWRSVASIEIHMLLNSIQNSSTSEEEEFVYSIDGAQFQKPDSLASDIDHYKMHRREFFSVISLKNAQD